MTMSANRLARSDHAAKVHVIIGEISGGLRSIMLMEPPATSLVYAYLIVW